ncbi:MAG TPA: PhzF family phenazine biosynthesis protein [Phycisphaerales bacterium]|nr:PhzF family phenazine biosynthesis protein [Phycisphaerales bacterium]
MPKTKQSARKPAKGRSRRKPVARRVPAPPARTGRISFPIFHVDAFTSRPLHGNPAAVVLIDGKWPDDALLQAIAAETNQPMTAFVQAGKGSKGKKIGLRWFNARQEFELCGHATLAAAHVLFDHMGVRGDITFATDAGDLPVSRDDDRYVLAMRARPPVRVRITNDLCAALGHEPSEVHISGETLVAVFDNKRAIHELEPDFSRLARLDAQGFAVTAPAAGHDYVGRYFAPRHGLNEDHATGSMHALLVPYWAKRLGKKHLTAHQVSHRAGEMWCELDGDRVRIAGHAVTVGRGTLTV